ncbi:MAG: GntR family transcriptional regulator [Desulfocucumaceae bacterium]
MSFPHLKTETLKENVLHILRTAILSGELKPGERLVESKLADEMGISRGPVREAVSQLKSEGLLKVIPHKGTFVVEWSDRDLQEVYLLRSVLEGFAARRVAELFTDKDYLYLQGLLDKAKALPAEGAVSEISGICLKFHEYICGGCGLPRLYEMWSVLNIQRNLFSVLSFSYYSRELIIEKHQKLLDELCSGDPAVAEESMRCHIMDAMDHVGGIISNTN